VSVTIRRHFGHRGSIAARSAGTVKPLRVAVVNQWF
jgi:hypothetical protein